MPDYTPLETAILRGADVVTIRGLLDGGADPNESTGGGGPLGIAVSKGDPEVVGLLLERGADPTSDWFYVDLGLLHSGSDDSDDYAIAQLLTEAGADPCARPTASEWSGMLPSEVAASEGRSSLAELLRALETECDS